ncbi:MAG TPA: tyrosine-type recombinase/integrase [Candidatus Babeliales bacterium]|nr:tyrosine-type recombinase/integrase [Candidatus Babeliales bacterium]
MSIFVHFHAYMLTERRLAHNTYLAYKRDLAQFELFLQKNSIALEVIRAKHVKHFLRTLRAVEDLTARSLARKVATLKLFFSYAHERFNIQNCGEHLITPKIKKALPQYLSEQEVEAFLAAAEADNSPLGIRNKVIVYLLYISGMRISELTALYVSSIHFDTGFLKVHGKGDKERMIPVPLEMMSILREYLQTVHREFIDRKGGCSGEEYLFPTSYSGKIKPITRQACWVILNTIWEKTAIKKRISPHQLRHSLATHMLKNGVDLRSLQLILGHENIMTVEVYTHVEVSHLRESYDKSHPRS